MNVLFNNSTDFILDKTHIDLIESVVKETLDYENFYDNCEISFSLVENNEIKKINKKYRGIDSPTDVLSFPLIDFNCDKIKHDDKIIILGDIIISIDKLKEQSKEYGHSFERELAFLTAHSMLHLLGYDHEDPAEEAVMFKKQDEILNNLGITRQRRSALWIIYQI